jgi:hemolysin activation/secretion protein
VLFPLHPVDRIELRGDLGTPGDVRRVITDRFGNAPSAGRVEEVANAIRAIYRQKGYWQARVTPRIEETHNPDRATMAFEIVAGPRALIGSIDIDEVDASDQPVSGGPIALRVGGAL